MVQMQKGLRMKTTYWVKNPYKMYEIDKDNGEFVVIIVEGQKVAVPAHELKKAEFDALVGHSRDIMNEMRQIKKAQATLSFKREVLSSELEKLKGLIEKIEENEVADVAVSE